jgi:hypothetical protein
LKVTKTKIKARKKEREEEEEKKEINFFLTRKYPPIEI